MKERRKAKRTNKYFAINIVSVDNDGRVVKFDNAKTNPKFWDESGMDFSSKGLRMMCSKPLPVESKIQMKMLIPEEGHLNLVRANGTIKWFKEVKGSYKKFFIIGVAFKGLSQEDKKKVVRLWKKYG